VSTFDQNSAKSGTCVNTVHETIGGNEEQWAESAQPESSNHWSESAHP